MAVPRRPRKPRTPRAPKAAYGRSYKKWMSSEPDVTVHHAVSGSEDLQAAAEVIADAARRIAGGWSKQIPPAIEVKVEGSTATISCAVGPAYPNEVEGVRHPVFGMTGGPDDIRLRLAEDPRYRPTRKGSKRGEIKDLTGHWVRNQYRPFLAPAADENADKATAKYADKVDRMCRARGFK